MSCSDGDSLKENALLNICIALKPAPGRYCDLRPVRGKAGCVRFSNAGTKVVEKRR